ncbi:hypothetical protein SAMN04515674_102356 [Pseudarcicella hirudinis]|uniref:Uncharacterized protein n=1 Tax=Pseudarcicella hirudinis TaxID=1079859 RepID=A0A1I5P9Q0_9BACT|nr:hypothetical protein [Pseudarcicella hirudinis]SFP30765.1 hypothetical protein SAMN04515674_102356 [Pseudarcicella hirudinis]
MLKLVMFIGLFVISEMLIAFLFAITAQLFYKRIGFDFRSIIKGVIERLFLLIALVNGYAHALTFFSALKLATRLKHEEKAENVDKYNDYYLIGNLVSVIFAIIYVYIWQNSDNMVYLISK